MNRYAKFDEHEDSVSLQAEWEASSDSKNHWPAERYLPEAIEGAAESLGSGLAWFGFWLGVGMAAIALAPLALTTFR